jgi:3-methyladenine DNA glycosylase/8-oxoguanine DNA glycosylase
MTTHATDASTPSEERARAALARQDPVLGQVMAEIGLQRAFGESHSAGRAPFGALLRTIIGQQNRSLAASYLYAYLQSHRGAPESGARPLRCRRS